MLQDKTFGYVFKIKVSLVLRCSLIHSFRIAADSVSLTVRSLQAPNIAKLGDTFYCYYSVSFIGSQDSQIGVATSKSLNPGTWTDLGSFNVPKSPDYNLIDPAIFQENANSPIYFTFGSYWGGIYESVLPQSALTQYTSGASGLTNIVRNSTAGAQVVEGATLFKWENKYYVFFSAGNCCATPPNLAPAGQEYRTMVCRSDRVEGPYVDRNGKNCVTESGGTVVLGSHGDVYAPGGQGVMYDDQSKKVVLYYHYSKSPFSLLNRPTKARCRKHIKG